MNCIGKKDKMIFKIDFEKAYNKMKWQFLFQTLRFNGTGRIDGLHSAQSTRDRNDIIIAIIAIGFLMAKLARQISAPLLYVKINQAHSDERSCFCLRFHSQRSNTGPDMRCSREQNCPTAEDLSKQC